MRFFILAIPVLLTLGMSAHAQEPRRPNILWITCEDIGPHLACYGDRYSKTPNLDRLAARGVMYRTAWSNAPVCAPARTTIISGLYPPSTGSEHMRSMTRLPTSMAMYPLLLRRAGYYCTNHIKEDYNLEKNGKVWDDSSKSAHWKNRKPGQPFFAVFNILVTHESKIRSKGHKLVHDPAGVRVPAYHPDTPEVRHDWAQYYDNIASMDPEAGALLAELERAGLAEDTIIFFFGDHGSGMPRNKRFPYNSGLQVPLIVSIPPRYRHLASKDYVSGGSSDRLVSFVDLAPTLLNLIDERPPEWMQGQAFLGKHQALPREFLHGFRGRMDERTDMMRTVRDGQFSYIRNYMPHRPAGQHVSYMFATPTTVVWKKLFDQGKLNPAQKLFWEPRQPEELYDLKNDPDEVKNLASSPEYQDVLKRLRKEEQDWVFRVRDVGFLPEGEIHSRSKESSPYEMGHNDKMYPLKRIFDTAELASSLKPGTLTELKGSFKDGDSAVRYWAALGILMRGQEGWNGSQEELARALKDQSPYVRIVAAETLGRFGSDADLQKILPLLVELATVENHDVYVSMAALAAIDNLGARAASIRQAVGRLPMSNRSVPARVQGYNARLIEHILAGGS